LLPCCGGVCALLAGVKFDVVLSSGFLAFAHHSGFLQAVEEVGKALHRIRPLLLEFIAWVHSVEEQGIDVDCLGLIAGGH
jgi:hypothetical protein